jgi:DNA-binding response OmpR family regulator
MLKKYFELKGYIVITAEDGLDAIKKAGEQPDLILLDVNMPGVDGIEVCRRIRDFIACPILFLTAKVDDADKIRGLSIGGDDYIVKPFSIDELGARVSAHLRRELRKSSGEVLKTKVNFDDEFVIDYTAQEVYYRNKQIILTKKEFEIIELLSQYKGQLFSKDRIFESIWDYDSDTDISVVATNISTIRAKFEQVGCKPYIQTVWGSGYKWLK